MKDSANFKKRFRMVVRGGDHHYGAVGRDGGGVKGRKLMNIEEAIKILESGARFLYFLHPSNDVNEAFKMALAALYAQQTPAKLDRSRWEGCDIGAT